MDDTIRTDRPTNVCRKYKGKSVRLWEEKITYVLGNEAKSKQMYKREKEVLVMKRDNQQWTKENSMRYMLEERK